MVREGRARGYSEWVEQDGTAKEEGAQEEKESKSTEQVEMSSVWSERGEIIVG